MRIVAGHAALNFYGGMLEHKRPALLYMAPDAGFRSGIGQTAGIPRAVRIVAVRTLHQAFWNSVMLGLGKLRLHRLMASKAKSGFGQFEETVMPPAVFVPQLRQLKKITLRIPQVALTHVLHFIDQMGRVALSARNSVTGVFGVLEQFLLLAAGMARQAARCVFFGFPSEGKNRMVRQGFRDFHVIAMRGLHRIAMRLSWPVASLASMNVILARKHDLRVARLFILNGFVLVAIFACLWARKFRRGRGKLRRATGDGWTLQGFRPFLSGASRREANGQRHCCK